MSRKKKNKTEMVPMSRELDNGTRNGLIFVSKMAQVTEDDTTTLDTLFNRNVQKVTPFGYELTFVAKTNDFIEVEEKQDKCRRELARLGIPSGIDDCLLEVPSPVFYSIEEGVEFYNKVSGICKKHGLFSALGDKDNGGLHIRLDIEEKTPKAIKKRMQGITMLYQHYQIVWMSIVLNEPGDIDNALPLVTCAGVPDFIPSHDVKTAEKLIYELEGTKSYAISFDKSTAVPSIEFRHFDSPKDVNELVMFLKIVQILYSMSGNVEERLREINTLKNVVESLFPKRIERHKKFFYTLNRTITKFLDEHGLEMDDLINLRTMKRYI